MEKWSKCVNALPAFFVFCFTFFSNKPLICGRNGSIGRKKWVSSPRISGTAVPIGELLWRTFMERYPACTFVRSTAGFSTAADWWWQWRNTGRCWQGCGRGTSGQFLTPGAFRFTNYNNLSYTNFGLKAMRSLNDGDAFILKVLRV